MDAHSIFARAALVAFDKLGSDETYTPPGGDAESVRVVFERDAQEFYAGLEVPVGDPRVLAHFRRDQVRNPRIGGTVTDTATSTTWRLDGIVRVDEFVVVVSLREAAGAG